MSVRKREPKFSSPNDEEEAYWNERLRVYLENKIYVSFIRCTTLYTKTLRSFLFRSNPAIKNPARNSLICCEKFRSKRISLFVWHLKLEDNPYFIKKVTTKIFVPRLVIIVYLLVRRFHRWKEEIKRVRYVRTCWVNILR